ncbi:hypothetical protein [Salinicola endophyticus]|uniref:hypothetical protein n=1 Tax=Salinicola endophyticus TaxID=1949083 RepID=UPI0013002E99|nr:hypothetical protein [Salinicola endophyticus]
MDLQYFRSQGERPENLDLFTCLSIGKYSFFILADGYGDSSEEDINNYLQEICFKLISPHQKSELSDVLKDTIPERAWMSILIAKVSKNEMEICSIGDCRAYINERLITSDDSLAWQNLSKRKCFGDVAKLVAHHPLRHKLTDSMTPQRRKDIIKKREAIYNGDTIIFCTDGIWPIFHEDICSGSFSVKDLDVKTEDNSLAVSIML